MELNKRIRGIEIPQRMSGLPLSDEGYPVPYFVPWVTGDDGHRRPEFRGMDSEKFFYAIRNKRCWLCGQPLGKYMCFPIGPMCAVTRTTAEPPSHLECAVYGARACPFLTQPRMRRNERDLPEHRHVAGIAIKRNPGCIVLWSCTEYKLFRAPNGGYLFTVGEPTSVEVWAEGRLATLSELTESIRTGYPLLEAIATQDGDDAELQLRLARAMEILKIRPEMMFLADRGEEIDDPGDSGSGNGGTARGEDAPSAQARDPGAEPEPSPQPLGGPEVRQSEGQ